MSPPFPISARQLVAALYIGLLGAVWLAPLRAAPVLTQDVDPPQVDVGEMVKVTFTLQNGADANITLPRVDGLQPIGSSSMTNIAYTNGALSSSISRTFVFVPEHAGDFTIPAFDINTSDGQVVKARAMKIHVVAANAPASPPSSPPTQGTGPVVMPPISSVDPNAPAADASAPPEVKPPLDSDGRPAKVFMVITAQTTDAYVGEAIPLRIEFYRRADASADQNALPTIQGSDFLMNNLSYRPAQDDLELMDEPYHRDTWLTAISASRSGDYPLTMVRDTYWAKNSTNLADDPIGNLFGRRNNLAHGNISSNPLIIHARPLPAEGRPPGFTGAIGQFKVNATSSTQTAQVGDPLYLNFNITGQGNFDSVHCPMLSPNPNWKSYTSNSQVHYHEESRTQGEKVFQQAIIPRKSGTVPLPAASFSYFDPTEKKYVTIPVSLPAITVTGTSQPEPALASTPADNSPAAAVSSASPGLEANRLDFGSLHSNLTPVYRQPWFWLTQGGVLALALIGALGWYVRSHFRRDDTKAQNVLRRRSLVELEAAMSQAVQQGDAPGFFLAARRAVQQHWATQWHLPPDSVTLPEISARDPQLAEAAAPLFHQADEVMYSGLASDNLDLVDWERHVREDLLHPQGART